MVRFKVRQETLQLITNRAYGVFQNRWLLVEFIPFDNECATYLPSENLNSKHIWNALKDSVIANFGDTGWGAVGASLTGESFNLKLFLSY